MLVVSDFVSVRGGFRRALSSDESLSGGGAIGLLAAFLFLLGGAFAISFPIVLVSAFMFAGVLALAVGVASEFSDMAVWAFVSFVLALMSLFGIKEKRAATRSSRVVYSSKSCLPR